MRLDQELVQKGLCESRQEAQELIENGFVMVNNVVTTKQTKKIIESDVLVVTGRRRFVSRGGEKLSGVFLDIFGDDNLIKKFVQGKNVLDVGSSTGGFTDYLLTYGAAHVDAVDVGTSQLHNKLRSDSRVSIFENTDIRVFKPTQQYDVIVCDVSFISLSSIFDGLISLGQKGTAYFLLIKPQFEVGKGNTKKGIVKDETLTQSILEDYKVLSEKNNLSGVRILPCHVVGGDGNQEYFLYGVLE